MHDHPDTTFAIAIARHREDVARSALAGRAPRSPRLWRRVRWRRAAAIEVRPTSVLCPAVQAPPVAYRK